MTAEIARKRAEIISRVREFFRDRNVLEVETPVMSHASTTDCHLDVFESEFQPVGAHGESHREAAYLHTSPEFAMKRLLAAGYGDIYQLCKVFRNGENGRIHNPEFTMLEWYRIGFSMDTMINEVAQLLYAVLGNRPIVKMRYVDCFLNATGLDPLEISVENITAFCASKGRTPPPYASRIDGLQYIMAEFVEPTFPPQSVVLVTHYPADQAVFAMVDPHDARVALRFEAYYSGIELANGFQECGDPEENERRMVAENARRISLNKPELPIDNNFLQALRSGLPPCSGVAIGLDRLIMLTLGKKSIDEVITFPWERS